MAIYAFDKDRGVVNGEVVSRSEVVELLARMDTKANSFSLKLISRSGRYISFDLLTPDGGCVATDLGGGNYSAKRTCFCLREEEALDLVNFLNNALKK